MTIDANTRSSILQDAMPAAVWFDPSAECTAHRPPDDTSCTRIRAADLRDAMRKTARSGSTVPGEHAVLIDIDVILDDDASEALRRYDEMDSRSRETLAVTLHYVGTPAGLAGLLSDIRTLGIADGVVVVPVHLDPKLKASCLADAVAYFGRWSANVAKYAQIC